ncbi:MAG: nickel ABC transporter permease [Oscillospiraceae bacterium]|nr:nickel ABC transporter permease [Oscillospiraceae bacterium]
MGYVGLIALFVIGVMMFWKPELMWKIEHLLSVKGGEPTDFYLSMMRIGGVVFAVIAVILAISFW